MKPIIKFEYMTVKLDSKVGFDVKVLNKWGLKGWKFIETLGFDDYTWYLFERQSLT